MDVSCSTWSCEWGAGAQGMGAGAQGTHWGVGGGGGEGVSGQQGSMQQAAWHMCRCIAC